MMDELTKVFDALQEWLIIAGVGVVVGTIQHFGNKAQNKKVEKVRDTVEAIDTSISKPNGGSSVKDALNRVEAGNQWLDGRMDRVVDLVERVVVKQEQDHHLLVTHIEECKGNGEGN